MYIIQYTLGGDIKERSGNNLTEELANTLMQDISYIEVFNGDKQLTGKEIRDIIQNNK